MSSCGHRAVPEDLFVAPTPVTGSLLQEPSLGKSDRCISFRTCPTLANNPPKPSWSCKLNPLLKTLLLPSVISNSIQGHVILLSCDARSSYPVSWHIISCRLLSLLLLVK